MQIDIMYLVIAACVGVGAGGLLYWFQNKRISTPSRRLTWPKIVFCVLGITVAVYHILNVVSGAGRTGWP